MPPAIKQRKRFFRDQARQKKNKRKTRLKYPFREMVSHVLPLEDIGKGFEALNGTYRLGDEVVIKIAVQGGE